MCASWKGDDAAGSPLLIDPLQDPRLLPREAIGRKCGVDFRDSHGIDFAEHLRQLLMARLTFDAAGKVLVLLAAARVRQADLNQPVV